MLAKTTIFVIASLAIRGSAKTVSHDRSMSVNRLLSSSQPLSNDQLLSTSQSLSTEQLSSTIQPLSTDQLLSSSELLSTSQPLSTGRHVSSSQPVSTDQLLSASQPLSTSQPVSTNQPVPSNASLAQLISHCTVNNTVALTFDDGPYLYLENITDILSAANVTGTFFFNGNNYDCIYNPDEMQRVQYAYDHGHQVASHTWSHKNLAKMNRSRISSEMAGVELALQRIVGVVPAFTRPPYGDYNELVQRIAYKRNQTLVLWDFDSGDSMGATAAESKSSYAKLIATHPSTILALNHEVYKTTVDQILPFAISKLQAAGYNLVSLAECLNMPAYNSQGTRGTPDPTWHC
ncbi:putative carbohydrate esterase family 4 protein [Lyophyllum shimeji]|uniref:Carbohydrate esterase family 4 protein n=1 Tax=Lyophyllum shimeji TaxID=47721 RepID=A0A9P3Q321_LYOSH|nr:putative carbohydrate esterase family 4 protein [Lyophyllum shimeji]